MFVYLCYKQSNSLEIVNDLTVETFLLAFQRFSSHRSLSKIVVSDNASTYLAAADKLQQLLQSEQLTEVMGRRGILWHFIPKRAPCMVWWVVGATNWINQDVSKESLRQIKSQLNCSANSYCRNRGHSE